MQSPFELLGVASNATDAEIKQAYLRRVKENPPDSDPERFQSIHNAYTSIKDAKSRICFALFTIPDADFDGLLDRALESVQPPQINAEQLVKLLRTSIDDTTFQNALTNFKKS